MIVKSKENEYRIVRLRRYYDKVVVSACSLKKAIDKIEITGFDLESAEYLEDSEEYCTEDLLKSQCEDCGKIIFSEDPIRYCHECENLVHKKELYKLMDLRDKTKLLLQADYEKWVLSIKKLSKDDLVEQAFNIHAVEDLHGYLTGSSTYDPLDQNAKSQIEQINKLLLHCSIFELFVEYLKNKPIGEIFTYYDGLESEFENFLQSKSVQDVLKLSN